VTDLPALPDLIGRSARDAFLRAGAGALVDETVSWIRDTVALARGGTVLAPNSVIETLVRLDYDPDDSVYVVWRAEGRTNFWTQQRKGVYLDYLKRNVEAQGGTLNQRRVMVYDDRLTLPDVPAEDWNVMPADHIFHALRDLHPEGTFLATPASTLSRYPLVASLRFGFTLSTRHGYVVIPVPFAEDLEPAALAPHASGGHRCSRLCVWTTRRDQPPPERSSNRATLTNERLPSAGSATRASPACGCRCGSSSGPP
jgi:hypothetical protein